MILLSSECKGCSYVHWAVGIGQGIRCTHPDHRTTAQPPIPLICDVIDCQKFKAREPAQKIDVPTDKD